MSPVTELTDAEQDRMCEICENELLCNTNKTKQDTCEGKYCEQAYKLLVEESKVR